VVYQFLSESYANEFSRLNTDVPKQKAIIAPLSEDQVASLQRGGKVILRMENGSEEEIPYSVTLVKGMGGPVNQTLQPTDAAGDNSAESRNSRGSPGG
jgi:hypothetical protein